VTTDRDRRVAEKIDADREALEALADSDFNCARYADALLAWADAHGVRETEVEAEMVPPEPAGGPGGGSVRR
jgi:pyrroloquinoline quinone (PQQ) biosynthesis protein C